MIDFPGPIPASAVAFIKNKGLRPGFSWLDVWLEEHGYAFTVAKAMQVDVLTTIQDELVRALENGTTLHQFKKDLEPALVRLGWWGVGKVKDPISGKTRKAQLGSPRRLRTIYQANMRQARAAGQWDRIQRTTERRGYLIYGLGPSEKHREEHLLWNGRVLPADDPWWDTHFPPNGWG